MAVLVDADPIPRTSECTVFCIGVASRWAAALTEAVKAVLEESPLRQIANGAAADASGPVCFFFFLVDAFLSASDFLFRTPLSARLDSLSELLISVRSLKEGDLGPELKSSASLSSCSFCSLLLLVFVTKPYE